MRKLFFIGIVLTSCSDTQEKKEVWNNKSDVIVMDSVYMDSLIEKATNLIISTEDSYKKVEKIKQISVENITLKEELRETKEELKEAKLEIIKLDSLAKPKKKNFIQKIVENFKDTIK
jgi:hypothetical protein